MAEFQYSSGCIALRYVDMTLVAPFIMRLPLCNQTTG